MTKSTKKIPWTKESFPWCPSDLPPVYRQVTAVAEPSRLGVLPVARGSHPPQPPGPPVPAFLLGEEGVRSEAAWLRAPSPAFP